MTDAHVIVAERPMQGDATRYTCACGEQITANPAIRDEAFRFHLSSVTPPAAAPPAAATSSGSGAS